MSEQKIISPLLDGFSMGNPMSEHDGVRCCPAIKENTDKKYIVKIITIPASQVQLDALLLAGAYKDPADAMEYYRQIGEGIMKEAELLKTLSKLDGFLPYEGWQMEPITRRRLGYEIYLVGSYKRTLERYVKQHPVTQLEAINLGLDLCSALSICRQAGALYADLKPNNIFVSEKKEYRIGDLGFIQLDALSYTALPDKYYSAYTPPELMDPMASLNMTVDTYAVGMILYQLYNDGQLPFKGMRDPEATLPSPIHADYELAEIIMKAIHIDPAERWNEPAELGKALASYMQRNSINDVPITPHIPLDVDPKDIVPFFKKKKGSTAEEEQSPQVSESVEEEAPLPVISEDTPADESPAESLTEIPLETVEEVSVSEDPAEEILPEPDETIQEAPADESLTEDTSAEEAPPSEVEAVPETEAIPSISDEVSKILSQADDLIAHEPAEGVMMPEIPEPPDPFAFIEEDMDYADEAGLPPEPLMEEDKDSVPAKRSKKKAEKTFQDPKYKQRKKRFFSAILTLLILCLIGLAGFWYYQNLYLRTIESLTIEGTQDQITVTVVSDADPAALRVTCSDQYGKSKTSGLTNGQAVFTELNANTLYTVELEIDGFHDLIGKTSDVFTTEATTNIVSFTSIAGAEDGSVLLSFTVDGEEPNDWTVFYSADGEEEKRKTFTGHTVNITGLTVGKIYTFTLETGESIALGGNTSLELLAPRLILAEDITITSENDTDITVHWKAPGDVVVDSWTVRCFNGLDYDQTLTVADSQVSFPNIDPSSSYTVEITASGMTQPARAGITEDPIRISAVNVKDTASDKLTVTWEHSGKAPEDGWLLIYSIDGGQKNVVKNKKASAVIPMKIPGATYELSIQASDGTTIFNNVSSYPCPEGKAFNKHHLNTDMLDVKLARVPADSDWYTETLEADAVTGTFAPNEQAAILLHSSGTFYMTGVSVDVLCVIRDAYGNVLPDLITQDSPSWKSIWETGEANTGEILVPQLPAWPGEFTLELYFDGMKAAEVPFTITQ